MVLRAKQWTEDSPVEALQATQLAVGEPAQTPAATPVAQEVGVLVPEVAGVVVAPRHIRKAR
jgi:hypothetical protein